MEAPPSRLELALVAGAAFLKHRLTISTGPMPSGWPRLRCRFLFRYVLHPPLAAQLLHKKPNCRRTESRNSPGAVPEIPCRHRIKMPEADQRREAQHGGDAAGGG